VGQSPGQASSPSFLASLESFENSDLHARLRALDPRFGERIHPNDRYRLTRFLDLTERQGLSFESLFMAPKVQGLSSELPPDKLLRFVQGTAFGAEELASRLASRLDQMLAMGWLDEIRGLLERGVAPEAPAFQSVGYRELLPHVQGTVSLESARTLALQSHLQLAKKQRTWLRGLARKRISGE